MRIKIILLLFVYAGTTLVLLLSIEQYFQFRQTNGANVISAQKILRNIPAIDLPVFSVSELQIFDGADPTLPIYIGLDGYVYDVSSGKDYYGPGGRYHNLAGKDSSTALRLIGGSIIKQKYPIIGVLK